MNIVDIKLDELKPYENNPRNNEEAVEPVAKSIKEFGFKVPIVIDKNNIIIAGHTRYKAAKKLGLNKVPCIVADDLTDEQVNAFRLVDNKVGEIATWDLELLNIELENILDIDMSEFSFDLDLEIDEVSTVEDEYDVESSLEEIKEPKAKPGDIYLLGNHRLMCGDSTNSDDVEKLMDGKEADLLLTDPPYNVAVENSQGMTIENDDMMSMIVENAMSGSNLERSNYLWKLW